MIGGQQQVAAEQLMGLQAQCLLDAIGEKAYAGQRRYGQHQGDAQNGEFAGAPVARKHAQRKPQRNHEYQSTMNSREGAEGKVPARLTLLFRQP